MAGQETDRLSVVVGDKREGWYCVPTGGAFCCRQVIHLPARPSNVSVSQRASHNLHKSIIPYIFTLARLDA